MPYENANVPLSDIPRPRACAQMGHNRKVNIDACTSKCSAHGLQSKVLISVREPYSYWASVYEYAWQCIYGDCNSAEAIKLTADPDAGINLEARQKGVLATFESFLNYSVSKGLFTEAGRIEKACGDPCRYDEVIHTESMTAEWAALLQRYPGLPQVALPRINEAADAASHHPWGKPCESLWSAQRLGSSISSATPDTLTANK